MRSIVPLGSLIRPAPLRRAGSLDYPLLSMTMHSGLVDQTVKFKKRVASADLSQYRVVERGELVVGFPIDEGVLSFQRVYPAAVVSPAYGIWDLSSGDIDPSYLERYLRSPVALSYYAAKLRGSTARRRSLPTDVFLELPVPLPPLAEQRRIAAILDQADVLRAKRRQTLSLLDDLTQAVFLDMFGDPQASSWPTVNVASIAAPGRASIRTGPFGSQLLHSEFVESGVAVLGIDNAVNNEFRWGQRRYITEEKYRALARYTVRPGDVLITIMGTCGRCAIVPNDIPTAINTKHLCCITVDSRKCLPEFLHASFLWQPVARTYLRSATKGAIMEGLNMGLIKDMPMVLPPIEAQLRYLNQRRDIHRLRAVLAASTDQMDEAFASTQGRAFLGRL